MENLRLEDCHKAFQTFISQQPPRVVAYYHQLAKLEGGWTALENIYSAGQINGMDIAKGIREGTYVK
jgi:hypothetical protein